MDPFARVWPREAEAHTLFLAVNSGWDVGQKAGAFVHFFTASQATELTGSSGKPSYKLD